ncbi:phage portal protein, partial [Enterococcus faecium]|nr:phage portal protein [Enterococcus faecium]
MSLFEIFKQSTKNEQPSNWLPDIVIPEEVAQRSYLKTMAKNTVLDFVSRTMSTLKISFKNKTDVSEWEYILNVRPNKDMSASVFWEKFFYRLLDENEVLVIFTDDNQLLIAEDFTRNEYATYEDTFENVLVKDYIFQRT